MKDQDGQLLIAFPKSEMELQVVFSEPVDPRSAEDPASYVSKNGLKIMAAKVDRVDSRRVTLVTEPMNGEAMVVDVLSAPGVSTESGKPLQRVDSPEFIQGIASIPEIKKSQEQEFPFPSRYVGKIASASCGKDGGVDSNVLIDTFGFAFIHMETGGPFNSLKIVTKKHIPGILEATRQLRPGLTSHVLWAGGEIQTIDGETLLVDSGFMEGSIISPTPLRSPPPFPISTAELGKENGRTLRAKGFQGVIVRFQDVVIESVSEPDQSGLRSFVFHDQSGSPLSGILLHTVTTHLFPGQQLSSLRGLIHQPRAGKYEVIIELDQHLILSVNQFFGHVTLVEGYALPQFNGCHALVALRDTPGSTVAILTTEHRLQTLLETALHSGYLVGCWGTLLTNPPTPRGASWAVDVYEINGLILYDRP